MTYIIYEIPKKSLFSHVFTMLFYDKIAKYRESRAGKMMYTKQYCSDVGECIRFWKARDVSLRLQLKSTQNI